jgi:hypothetical protein
MFVAFALFYHIRMKLYMPLPFFRGVIHDSTEKRSFPPGRWGKLAQKALFLMMPSLNLTVFQAKVGRCPC